ncbi:hypothetical protein BDR04DRAFT_1063830 [Suillus decipiens]|nr:hypothetical protein BDR04DRAFT_1063830 [Suillus decipiens]
MNASVSHTIMGSSYTRVIVAGSVFHGIAIVCTIFRLVYRGWTRRIWWEDAWAAVSLVSDALALTSVWWCTSQLTDSSRTSLTDLSRTARMSVIFCIIRIANHSGSKVQKWTTRLIAVSFACMWVALLVQKVYVCVFHACHLFEPVALSQLITDVIADISLVAAPLQFWKNAGLSRSKKILVLSSFSASILITVITIPHSVVLIVLTPSGNIIPITIIAHVKAAVSLIVCNLFVIVAFAYRIFSKETSSNDLDQSFTPPLFSTVILTQFPTNLNTGTSSHGQEGTMSSQITTGQTKLETDDTCMVSAEEGTNRMAGNMKDGKQ